MHQEAPNNPVEAATSSSTSSSRKLGLSCAECRRSKLKCDRVFPCQSCVRRGCAGICPDGTLAATKGNKVLMAHAQRLQEQVKTLTARCRNLEKELAEATGNDVDLLHHPDGDASEPFSNVSEGFGSLSIGLDGQAKYHGETASSEYFQDLLPIQDDLTSPSVQLDLPPDIIDLMNAFPFGLRQSPYTKDIFADYIPELRHAQHLAELYFVNIGWMYEPVTRQDFRTSVLEVIYGPNGDKAGSIENAHPHRLSLFFIILANGAAFHDDPRTVSAAKIYHALARASFSLDSILVEATCASVQTLFLIVRFIYNADRDRNEERWLLTGLNSRLAHMIGLQRDSANWNLPAEDVQRRRRFFWELFTWDAWSSVVNGRPAALAVQHTDCQFPDDIDPSIGPGKEMEIGWHAWKFRYSANILTASSYQVFSPRTPPYKALLDLDKKIRAFPTPTHLRSPIKNSDTTRSWNADPSRAMQQYCALCLRESNLLYIHRSYFALALRQSPANPLQHDYAASVLATYRSATRLIASLRSLYTVHPRLTSTVWYFWSGVFSSCIVLGALVVESPKCTLAPDALRELHNAIPFYEVGSRTCRSQATVPILQKLLHRACAAYRAGTGLSTEFTPSTSSAEVVDELQVLGGRKSVIKNTTAAASSNAGSPPTTSGGPDTPSSILIDRSDDGSSPSGSNTGALEMLQEYCGRMGQPPPPPPPLSSSSSRYDYPPDSKGPVVYDYDTNMRGVGSATAYSDDSAYNAKPSLISDNHPPQAFMRPFLSPPGSMMAPEPGLEYRGHGGGHSASSSTLPSPQLPHQQHQQHHHQWHQQHSSHSSSPFDSPQQSHTPHQHPSEQARQQQQQQQYPPQQFQSTMPAMYGHPLNVNPPHAFPQIIQRYGPGVHPEPTQEEIWRNFMVGYQQSG